jgi:hypothetical protein
MYNDIEVDNIVLSHHYHVIFIRLSLYHYELRSNHVVYFRPLTSFMQSDVFISMRLSMSLDRRSYTGLANLFTNASTRTTY